MNIQKHLKQTANTQKQKGKEKKGNFSVISSMLFSSRFCSCETVSKSVRFTAHTAAYKRQSEPSSMLDTVSCSTGTRVSILRLSSPERFRLSLASCCGTGPEPISLDTVVSLTALMQLPYSSCLPWLCLTWPGRVTPGALTWDRLVAAVSPVLGCSV